MLQRLSRSMNGLGRSQGRGQGTLALKCLQGDPLLKLFESTDLDRFLNKYILWPNVCDFFRSILHRVRKKGATLFFAITLPNANRSSKFFTITLSSKFAIKKSLNIPP